MTATIENLVVILKDAIAKIMAWIEEFKALTGLDETSEKSE